MVRAAAHHSKSLPLLFAVWLVVGACLLVGLMVIAIDRAAANDFRIAAVDLVQIAGSTGPGADAGDEPPPRPAVPIVADDVGPPVRYGGTSWIVTGSRLIPGTEQSSGRPIIVAEVIVTNTTDDTTTRTRIDDVVLVFPDGRREPVDRFEFAEDPQLLRLEPGHAASVMLVFKPSTPGDPAMEDLSVEIGEPGRTPAVVPLVGPAPASPFPAVGPIAGSRGQSLGPGNRSPGVRPLRVLVDLDAGPYRAAVGHRLAIIDVTVERAVLGSDASVLDSGFWALELADEVLTPERVVPGSPSIGPTSALGSGETGAGGRAGEPLTLIFVVDEDVTDVALLAAAVRFPIRLPTPAGD